MSQRIRTLVPFLTLMSAVVLVLLGISLTRGADHMDTPLLIDIGRNDARLTDLHAFTRGDDLVITLCADPTIPPDVTEYSFPSDLTFRINIDNDTPVSFDNESDVATYGGTISQPNAVGEDIVFQITFDEEGEPQLGLVGLPDGARDSIQFFAGLRDDPFILAPFNGRNVAAMVVQLPLNLVVNAQSTLLIWGTSNVPDVLGPFVELAGRAARSQDRANDLLNTLHPRDHFKNLGVPPDVVIFDTSAPAAFPNGRELTDDVLDLVTGQPIPGTENDVPFLDEFPYLAPPHQP